MLLPKIILYNKICKLTLLPRLHTLKSFNNRVICRRLSCAYDNMIGRQKFLSAIRNEVTKAGLLHLLMRDCMCGRLPVR